VQLKIDLIGQLLSLLEEEERSAEAFQEVSLEESRAHKGAMESRYDTFKEEAQYLAGGHARRRVELLQDIAALRGNRGNPAVIATADRVRLGALVWLKEEDAETEATYFLVSGGGGRELSGDDVVCRSLSIHSPLARALMLKRVGEVATLKVEGSVFKFEILRIL
jgi:transcription elongation GreA/GreB family factor